jgi:hypothetical protein
MMIQLETRLLVAIRVDQDHRDFAANCSVFLRLLTTSTILVIHQTMTWSQGPTVDLLSTSNFNLAQLKTILQTVLTLT